MQSINEIVLEYQKTKSNKDYNQLFNYMTYLSKMIATKLGKVYNEDATQNAIISILENMHTFDINKGSFSTWSYKIIYNEYLQSFRRSNKFSQDMSVDDDDSFEESSGKAIKSYTPDYEFFAKPDNKITYEELLDAIKSYMPMRKDDNKTLSNKQEKEVFELFLFSEMGHKEIASIYNVKENNIKTTIHNCKNGFRKHLISKYPHRIVPQLKRNVKK